MSRSVTKLRLVPALTAAAALALAFAGTATPTTAGCSVNVTFHSTEASPAPPNDVIEVDLHESKVKIKGGFWKKLSSKEDIETVFPGERAKRTFKLDFGCSSSRRYKFLIQDDNSSDEKTLYFPSSLGWTTKQSFTVTVKL
jgi:hypothetical protein